MKLAYWAYAGPAHIGTLRITSSFRNVHAIMHAPLGDDYFNVLRSMLQRASDFTPVTASVVDRHVLSGGSKDKVVNNIVRKQREQQPDLLVLTPTCTSSILQEDLQNFTQRAASRCQAREEATGPEVLLADVNHYRFNEFEAADRTLAQIVQTYCPPPLSDDSSCVKTLEPSVNIIGMCDLGFHHDHDHKELRRILKDLGINVLQTLPEYGSTQNLQYLPQAWCNLVPYREIGLKTATYLAETFDMPYVSTTPMGVLGTVQWVREIVMLLNTYRRQQGQGDWVSTHALEAYLARQTQYVSRAAWFTRSIDCQNLTGKKVVVFGDATHAAGMARILSEEMGLRVVAAGTYCKEHTDFFTSTVAPFCDQTFVTDNYSEVEALITQVEPAAIFGTQMERHIGKRLGIPCSVISAPVHIQNFPLGYRPFLGFEGTNQICDSVYNCITLGMEDHLLEIFGGHDTKLVETTQGVTPLEEKTLHWSAEAEAELRRIPGFVRKKVQRKTELYAEQEGETLITPTLMFKAKEFFSEPGLVH